MSEQAKFRVGNCVRFQYGNDPVIGKIVEDRGPIGIKGRRLYLITFSSPGPQAPSNIELPAEQLELVERFDSNNENGKEFS